MGKYMYKVVEGKHLLSDGSFARASDPDPIELDEEEAARFPNKFKLVTAPVEAAVEASSGEGSETK